MIYRLTPAGGARWEALVEADWSLYVSTSDSLRFGRREAQSRDYLEYILEIERTEGRVNGKVHWKELSPWMPLYWKTLPSGFQATFSLPPEDSKNPLSASGITLPPWGQELMPRFYNDPKRLQPRKPRNKQTKDRKNLYPVSDGKLEGAQATRMRRQFHAACIGAASAEADELLKMLSRPHGATRFAYVRRIAEKRLKEAVLPLTALVLRSGDLPALWTLGEIADERTLPVLEQLLKCGKATLGFRDSSWDGVLVRSISQYGNRALPMLRKLLQSENISVAAGAIQALGLIQTEQSVEILRHTREFELTGTKRTLRYLIDQALPSPGPNSSGNLFRQQQLQLFRIARIAEIPFDSHLLSDPIRVLVAMLAHPDPTRRRATVDMLTEFGARKHLKDIERLVTDEAWQVRASVAFAMRQFKSRSESLPCLAHDPNLVVRWLATHDILPPWQEYSK